LGSKGLFSMWSQVRAMWLLIWWPLKTYITVNFKAHRINWDTSWLEHPLNNNNNNNNNNNKKQILDSSSHENKSKDQIQVPIKK